MSLTLDRNTPSNGTQFPGKKGGVANGDDDNQLVSVLDPTTGQTIQVPAKEAASFASGGSLFSPGNTPGVGGVDNSYTTSSLPGGNKYTGRF